MTIFEPNKVYSANQLNKLGFTSNHLTMLISQNELIRLQRGYYVVNIDIDQFLAIIQLYPEAIVCLHSALYHYDYLDALPNIHTIAVSKANNRYKYKHNQIRLKAYFRDDKYINLGVKTSNYKGVDFQIYDKERTIIDCIRRKKLLSANTYKQAIQKYINDPDKNIDRLRNYAKILRIKDKVDILIEPWI
ncbi:MAG: hypothetical protein PHP11_05940 [Erysipelotrichaceae bacterium]|nr:hypothetical protein [Erysipelotrichaceae bacterium]MDD3924623.1 hypothetical protein [Erysipelotrichaceae bacterium]MDD4641972.1 hypothetical protein [Erysipelotrichaceae bacterium]